MSEEERRAAEQREEDSKTAALMRTLRKFSILGSDGTDRITILLLLDMLGSVIERLATKHDLEELKKLIIMTNAEAVKIVTETRTVLEKVVTEVRGVQSATNTLKEKIAELEKQIADGAVGADLAAALGEVKTAAVNVDNEIPDEPTLPPTPV
jgi:translation initiation factor 1 (eIF-1/SUI1)